MKAGFVIPWMDRGDAHRQAAYERVRAHLEASGLGEVFDGTYEDDGLPLSRSRLRNEGAGLAMAAGCDVIVFCDAETLVPHEQLAEAVELVGSSELGAVFPCSRWRTNLDEEQTKAVLAGKHPFSYVRGDEGWYAEPGEDVPWQHLASPAYAVRAEDHYAVGGFDEGYIGWGEEDIDYLQALARFCGPVRTVDGPVVALWHPRSDTMDAAFTEGTPEREAWLANCRRREIKVEHVRDVEAWRSFPARAQACQVAVYAIAKNEEANVAGWALSVIDEADHVLLVDTGSSDLTVGEADHVGVQVRRITVDPWRFDDARNAALALLPGDIDMCVALDLDERLSPGWAREVRELWAAGVTRPAYTYTWSWVDGQPDVQYAGDKAHPRRGARWVRPGHEVVDCAGVRAPAKFEIWHHADDGKPRDYLPLLALGAQEDPRSPRASYYYGRELFFHDRVDEAVAELKRFLAMPDGWVQERCLAMRHLAKMQPYECERWLLKACAEQPGLREPWLDLAELYAFNSMWKEAAGAAQRALMIQVRDPQALTEHRAWASGRLEEIAAWASVEAATAGG